MNISLTLTDAQAQAIYDLIDREIRMNGAQSAMVFGPITTELVKAVQEAKKASEEENTEESFLQEEDSLTV